VKTRLQALPPSTKSVTSSSESRGKPGSTNVLGRLKRWKMLEMLVRILKTEGLAGAFKGFSANMINTFSMRECLGRFQNTLSSAK
jgi:adenine nucleotide transporter 17